MKLETERLILRTITPDDLADYYEIFGNPTIAKYDDFPLTRDLEDAKNDIARIQSNYKSHTGDQEYAAQFKESGKVIGVLAYRIKESIAYVGYHFNESYHGQGFATEAMRAFLPWLIDAEYREIRAAVDPQNLPSIHVLEKLGFYYYKTKPTDASSDGAKEELIYRFPSEL